MRQKHSPHWRYRVCVLCPNVLWARLARGDSFRVQTDRASAV